MLLCQQSSFIYKKETIPSCGLWKGKSLMFSMRIAQICATSTWEMHFYFCLLNDRISFFSFWSKVSMSPFCICIFRVSLELWQDREKLLCSQHNRTMTRQRKTSTLTTLVDDWQTRRFSSVFFFCLLISDLFIIYIFVLPAIQFRCTWARRFFILHIYGRMMWNVIEAIINYTCCCVRTKSRRLDVALRHSVSGCVHVWVLPLMKTMSKWI